MGGGNCHKRGHGGLNPIILFERSRFSEETLSFGFTAEGKYWVTCYFNP
jgi:hypothetical protein